MSHYLVKGDTLTDIANAIRAKTGETEKMTTAEMPAAIRSITGAGKAAKNLYLGSGDPSADLGDDGDTYVKIG